MVRPTGEEEEISATAGSVTNNTRRPHCFRFSIAVHSQLNYLNMKYLFSGFCLFGLTLITLCCASCDHEAAKTETKEVTIFNLDSAKAAIAASNKIFSASFATGDSVAFANCYTSDGCIYNSNMPRVCGTDGIRSFSGEGYKYGIRNVALTTEEVLGGREAVVETGSYEVFISNNISVEKGKYVVVWKEENGKWKMYRDIWNSDNPPPPPPPTKK
jgi:ketosteroid isomerase-like protein